MEAKTKFLERLYFAARASHNADKLYFHEDGVHLVVSKEPIEEFPKLATLTRNLNMYRILVNRSAEPIADKSVYGVPKFRLGELSFEEFCKIPRRPVKHKVSPYYRGQGSNSSSEEAESEEEEEDAFREDGEEESDETHTPAGTQVAVLQTMEHHFKRARSEGDVAEKPIANDHDLTGQWDDVFETDFDQFSKVVRVRNDEQNGLLKDASASTTKSATSPTNTSSGLQDEINLLWWEEDEPPAHLVRSMVGFNDQL